MVLTTPSPACFFLETCLLGAPGFAFIRRLAGGKNLGLPFGDTNEIAAQQEG